MDRNSVKSIFLAVLSLASTACSSRIDMEVFKDYPLTFAPTMYSPSLDIQTKGAQCNTPADLYSIGKFTVNAFNSNGSSFVSDTEVTFNGSGWAMPGTAPLWKNADEKTFFASANLPASVASVEISEGKHTLNYAVPATAAAQNDILLGYYKGNGNLKGEAGIRFHHPLTAVRFKLADDCEYTVTGIELSGVYASGTDVVSYTSGTPANSWSYLTPGAKVTAADTSEVFILIPQTVAENAVKVKITAQGETDPFNGSIPACTWEPGKTNTYTVTLKEGAIGFTIDNATAQAYGLNSDDNIFPGGQDSDFWADLGMVSNNGYPLYISRKNVKKVENGIAYFAETDDESQSFYSVNNPFKDSDYFYIELNSEDGLPCRLISANELLSLAQSSSFSRTGLNSSVLTYTSEITGESVDFSFLSSNDYYFGSFNGSGSNEYLNNKNEIGNYSGTSVNLYARLVYEDVNAPRISLGTFELYSAGCNDIYYNYNICRGLEKVENGKQYNWSYGLSFFIKVECGNEYDLWSIEKVPSYTFVGFGTGNAINVSDRGLIDCKVSHDSQDLMFKCYISCFVKGTQITLADGRKKPVEEITYDDELKVWDFDEGHMDSAKVLWLTDDGLHNDHYIKCTFSDGTVLNVTGQNSHHKLYNCDEHYFQGVTKMDPGTRVFTENGIVTLVSKEWIEEEVEYYNLITDRHINCFADGVLTSARYNNTYPIDDEMKFVKDGRKKRPYKEFRAAGISREWYNGLRLGEQTDSLDVIKDYIGKCESQMAEKSAPTFWQRLRTWWRSVFCR